MDVKMDVINLSHSLRKRFVKDFSLPIQVFQDPYFEYMLDLTREQHNTSECLKWLEDVLQSKYYSEQEFFEYYRHLQNTIIDFVKGRDEYKEFCNDLDILALLPDVPVVKLENNRRDVYSQDCVGKIFISIDLEKANFQSMNFAVENMFNQPPGRSYAAFINDFTRFQYFWESKYFRQVIFGNLNPKRQQAVQKRIIDHIMHSIQTKFKTLFEDGSYTFVNKGSDEVIIQTAFKTEEYDYGMEELDLVDTNSKLYSAQSGIDYVLRNCNLPYRLKAEAFSVGQIGDKGFYYKRKFGGDWSLKAVPSIYWAQCFKKMMGLKTLSVNDLVFYHEGMLAKFLEPVFDDMEVV